MRKEIELYTRGLALAEGSVARSALRFHMSVEARQVLELIASEFEVKNGVRVQKQGSLKLTVPGKAWWKHSTEGLDTIHAFRGYIDGDGCWSYKTVDYRYKGVRYKNRYKYPLLVILVAEREISLLEPWLLCCLKGYSYWVRDEVTRLKGSFIRKFYLTGTQARRLYKNVYTGANIELKVPWFVGVTCWRPDKNQEDCQVTRVAKKVVF